MSSEPGIYFLGLPWQSRRGSSFIWGVWHDAKYLADQITMQLGYLAYGMSILMALTAVALLVLMFRTPQRSVPGEGGPA